MNLPQFLNALKSIYNIDHHQIPEMELCQWSAFLADPVRYFIAAPDAHQEAIWREVSKRQGVAARNTVPAFIREFAR